MQERPTHTAATAAEIAKRAAALQAMAVLDTPPEEGFDALTRLAANVCDAPIALISLIDGDRLWFKSVFGLEAASIDSARSFCCEAANSKTVLEVRSAQTDPRFADNGLVTGALGIRHYAGAPIVYNGVGIGTLCVLDYLPRAQTEKSLRALVEMATLATVLLRARIDAFGLFSGTR